MRRTHRPPAPPWALLLAPLLTAALLLAPAPARAQSCTNPGQDGPAVLSGLINTYYPGPVGSTVSAGSRSVPIGARDTRGSATEVKAGDLVIVMQMQDADISASATSPSYGGSSTGAGYTALNNAGVYEYATVASTYAGGSPLTLSAPLQYTYRSANATATAGQRRYQVIRIPQVSSARLTGTLTAPAWDGSTGGVVGTDVGGQLDWNGQSVDVSGRGFRGGAGLWLKGTPGTQTYSTNDHAALAPAALTGTTSANGAHGSKGEGIAGTPRYVFNPADPSAVTNGAGTLVNTGAEGYPNGSLARGAPGNAGGGGTDGNPTGAAPNGNDQNTGGGGGGGYRSGGNGGYGWTPSQTYAMTSGMGGVGIQMEVGRLVLGGGGGAGSTNNGTGPPAGGLASSGAAGGGIVLIRARTIVGTGTVNANGTTANQGVCNDASGGGGGGGAVLVFASHNNGAVGTLTINARGGRGGSNRGAGTEGSATCPAVCTGNNCPHGPGGGGGGGFAAVSTYNATVNVQGGSSGTTTPSAVYAPDATYGSASSDGGWQVYTVTSEDIPGAQASPYCYPALTVTKVTHKANTVQGSTTSYTVTATNSAGYGTAYEVRLRDTLPAGYSHEATTAVVLSGGATRPSTATPAVGATDLTWGSFTLPAGASVSVTFTARLALSTPLGVHQNPASVRYADPTRTEATQTVSPGETHVGGGAVQGSNYASASSTGEDVMVRIPATVVASLSQPSALVDQPVQLTFSLSNPNPDLLTGVGYTLPLPAGLVATGGAVTVSGPGCTGYTPASLAAGATSIPLSGGTLPGNGTCTITVSLTPTVAETFTVTLPTESVGNGLNVTNIGPVTLTLLARPTITKSFAPVAVQTNTTANMVLQVANGNAATALTNVRFTDVFPANLTVNGTPTVTGTGCGTWTVTPSVSGSVTTLSVSGGTLPAGGTCTLTVPVRSAVQGTYVNTITTGALSNQTADGAGPPSNSAELAVGVVDVSKVFETPNIAPNGTSRLTFTVTRPTTAVAPSNATFTDPLANMSISGTSTAVTTTCQSVTPATFAAGSTNLTFSAIRWRNGQAACTISVVVTSGTVGAHPNQTSGVATGNFGTGPASNVATLYVLGPASITQALSPAAIGTGQQSTLTFTLTNPNSADVSGAGFTSTLPANVGVAGTGTVRPGGTCPGVDALSFTAGASGALAFSGLTLPAGGTCTVTLPVTSTVRNTYSLTASAVTGTGLPAGTAPAAVSLLVRSAPTMAKAFAPAAVGPGVTSTITFTLTNANTTTTLTGVRFTDALVNMEVASTGPATGTCAGAGALSFTAGQTGTLTFGGLTVPQAASCTVVLPVRSVVPGSLPNTVSGATSDQTPVAGAGASATLTVYSPPELTEAFGPGVIVTGGTTTLTITVRNPNAVALTGVAFNNTLSNMTAVGGVRGGTCAGTATSFSAGATALGFSGLTVPAGASCTVTVQVTSSRVSPVSGWPNQSDGATSAQTPNPGSPSSPVALTVLGYAEVALEFRPAAIPVSGTSTAVFTLSNPNPIALTAASFSVTFPAGVTTTNTAQNYIGAGRGTCTGTLPGAQGAGAATATRTFSGTTIPANSSCTIFVDVTSPTSGLYTAASTGVRATETGTAAGPVSNNATLAVGRLGISKAFAPLTVGVGEQSTLTITLTNPGTTVANAGSVSLTDALPAEVAYGGAVTGNTCGGTVRDGASGTFEAGDTSLRLTGATVPANGSCALTVAVRPTLATLANARDYPNTITDLAYTVPCATAGCTPASVTGVRSNTATLTVVPKPLLAPSFSPATTDAYLNSTLTYTLNNLNTSQTLRNCKFTDTLNGYAVSRPAALNGTCTGVSSTPALAEGMTSLSLTIPTLNPGSCTISLPVTSTSAGTYQSVPTGLKCDELVGPGDAGSPATVTFRKFPLHVTKVASAATVKPGQPVVYTITYKNPNVETSLSDLVITDVVPLYTTFSGATCGALPGSITGCNITSPAAGGTGMVTWTLVGSLDPGAEGSVTLTVDVR
jgi:uncharacterized repeat protein (TIGR01451 family)/fimbrial isopeptide formation D2 family protein